LASLSWLEAGVIGAMQGVAELFPVSSLGHSVLIPALVGGSWASNLNVAKPESPYLAFIVGLHVATALALIVFFWRDWVRILRGLFSSIARREVRTPDQRLAWLLILATIPVGLVGLLGEHWLRTNLGRPIPVCFFLVVNGLILLGIEHYRRTDPTVNTTYVDERETGVKSDLRLSRLPVLPAVAIGAAQIAALAPGISRSGITTAAGLLRGLTREDAARFAFLLATPVIGGAAVLKLPELAGPQGHGILGQVAAGSVCAFVAGYVAVRFLTKYFETKTMTPFAIYCTVAGLGSLAYLSLS
jgi:undecaprenyl-diphosphatase